MVQKLPRYLTRRKGGWLWVQIAVPEEARAIIGKTVLRQYLGTKDLEIAKIEMGQYLTQFKRKIKAAQSGTSYQMQDLDSEAMGFRKDPNPLKHDALHERVTDINDLADTKKLYLGRMIRSTIIPFDTGHPSK